jgi:hypothetical protein
MTIELSNDAAVKAGMAAARMLGAPTPGSVVGGIINAALPHLTISSDLLTTVRQCRICGCTDDEACPGGCSWSQPEICSTCGDRDQEVRDLYVQTLRAQHNASVLEVELFRAQLEQIARQRVLVDEQMEVAKMQREDLVGVTWRQAVTIAAARVLGSAMIGNNAEDVRKAIRDEAELFAHELASPPVVF